MKIKEAAETAGVSARTLHHYDQVGLLHPAATTSAGYRLYGDREMERLQQILFFRELGFSLDEIGKILDSPNFDRIEALRAQKELLLGKRRRLDAIIASVDSAMEHGKGEGSMDKKTMFSAFDTGAIEEHKKKYAEETRRKYGGTDAYKESEKKTSKYTKEDWAAISARGDEIHVRLAALMERAPSDPEVQEAIGAWRKHISASFYECTLEIFRGLGDLYVDDGRFTANIDKYRPGLAAFMRAAMHIYCDRALASGL